MLKQQLFTLYVFFKSIILPCHCDEKKNTYQEKKGNQTVSIKRVGRLPPSINESSALLMADSTSLWTLNDSGGEPIIYRIDLEGNLLENILIPNSNNIDWETIASDNQGNLYIGDIGNNTHRRNNLVIYKYKLGSSETEELLISYPSEENAGNSPKYSPDAEAMIWKNDSLYIFTKHWKSKMVKLYSLPDQAGKHETKLLDSIFISSPVTGASITSEGNQFALLTYGKVYTFSTENGINFSLPIRCIRFARSGQSEGIASIVKNTWYISNENRKLFRVKIGR
jgi:hypothetical protein